MGLDRIEVPDRARRLFPTLPGRFTAVSGTVLSAADLSRALAAAPVRAVIHCAVITAGSARERDDPEGIVAVNVQGAVATLAAAARRGVARFVYPSSVAVYGAAARGVPLVREDEAPARPAMLYGLTKLACETLLPRVAEVGGLTFAAARLASVYGPWEYATGARDTLSPMLSALHHAAAGTEAILSTPGLGDFVYARDAAAGLAALADAPALRHTVYNSAAAKCPPPRTGAARLRAWCRASAGGWRGTEEAATPSATSHSTAVRWT